MCETLCPKIRKSGINCLNTALLIIQSLFVTTRLKSQDILEFTYREDLDVEDDEVECEGEGHRADEPQVGPWGHADERLVLRQTVHGVQHLDGDQHRQSHSHRVRVSEDFAVNTLEFQRNKN